MSTSKIKSVLFSDKEKTQKRLSEAVVTEAPLQIMINFIPYSITMRTPSADRELICGLLYSERVVYPWDDSIIFETIQMKDSIPLSIRLKIDPTKIKKSINDNRSLISSSACGVCGKRQLSSLELPMSEKKDAFVFETELIFLMYDALAAQQPIFKSTGACHAAAAFSASGELLSVYEDVGRHNAVDKVVGSLVLAKKLAAADILLVSGRVSYEIVYKAVTANFRVICAVSAPSSMAIEMAEEQGILLFGFCRNGRFTKYS